MEKEKVVLGMSGGVDSSVAAYILKAQGYEVIGVTMTVIPNDPRFEEREDGCCSISSVLDAKIVAERLGIKHYVMDFRGVFERKVIDYFVDEYLMGRTPNPCVACNKYIKFDEFLKKAQGLGAKYVATGHYASIEYSSDLDRYLLKTAEDKNKDQTYFLYGMTQYQLEHTLMPLAGYDKDQVREIAEKIGLEIHNKPDSEEICFIPDNNHGRFIEERLDGNIKPGNFVDTKGNILGRHKGIVYYTVGQRRGLGIALGKRVFVKEINPETRDIVLASNEDLYNKSLVAGDLNLISFDELKEPIWADVKIRYSTRTARAKLSPLDGGRILVEFEEGQRAITKGQAVVFYKDKEVLGGGTIEEVV